MICLAFLNDKREESECLDETFFFNLFSTKVLAFQSVTVFQTED